MVAISYFVLSVPSGLHFDIVTKLRSCFRDKLDIGDQ